MSLGQAGGRNPDATYPVLRRRVEDRIAQAHLDTDRDHDQIHQLCDVVTRGYQREAATGLGNRALRNPDKMVERLVRSFIGYGPLEPFIHTENPPVEVKARGSHLTWLDEFGRWHSSDEPTTQDELLHAVQRLLEPTGQVLNEAQPIVSTQVLDNRARLTAAIPPVADELDFALRFYRLLHDDLSDLVGYDSLTRTVANFLWVLMHDPSSGVLVTGRPRAGKTTMVNALLRAVPHSHEVLVVEDTRELNAPLMLIRNWRTRPRTGLSDKDSEITLRDLVALALRASPTRIVVGEVRGSEAVELTRASDAGAAMLATLHSHSAEDALDALSNAALLGDHNLSPEIVRATFARNVDIVVHLDSEDTELRGHDGDRRRLRRQVTQIVAVPPLQSAETRFTTRALFERAEIGAPLLPTGHPIPEALKARLNRVLRRYDTTIDAVLDGRDVMGQ